MGERCSAHCATGGFIPWDDDIDIAMRGEDVERFIKIAQAELPDNLVLQGPA